MERKFRVIEDFEFNVFYKEMVMVNGDNLNYVEDDGSYVPSCIIHFKKGEVYSYELLSKITNGESYEDYEKLDIVENFQEVSPAEEILDEILKMERNIYRDYGELVSLKGSYTYDVDEYDPERLEETTTPIPEKDGYGLIFDEDYDIEAGGEEGCAPWDYSGIRLTYEQYVFIEELKDETK